MSNPIKILIVCIHNSARSQMAEAFLQQMGGEAVMAESAGLEPGTLNPVVVEAMQEIGIDISQNKTQSVFDMLQEGREFDYVITVCDEAQAEKCPVFPGAAQKLHMGFPDPSSFIGEPEEKLAKTREVRDMIKAKMEEWIKTIL